MNKTSFPKGKVLIALNTAWNLVNFRAGLIRALVAEGYEVVAVAPSDEYAARLAELGCRFVALPIDNKGTHPGRDLLLFFRFLILLRRERPDVFLGYTVKPNVYGSLAARVLGIPVVNNIAGLGAVFIRDNWLTRLVRLLYKTALSRSRHVFFQNDEDMRLFVERGLVVAGQVSRLPGSGVDLRRFSPAVDLDALTPSRLRPPRCALPAGGRGGICFLLVARLLWDKGVGEYVEAARKVRRKHPVAEFRLLGFLDVQNPSAIPRSQVEAWVEEGVVSYLGSTDDVLPYLHDADCVVLPSYREGVPRTLLEAAAMAKPLITTDAPGCRDTVDDGVTGLLCRLRDANDLADKMLRMIEMDRDHLKAMGQRGREKMMREFDERIVIDRYLDFVGELAKEALNKPTIVIPAKAGIQLNQAPGPRLPPG